MSNIDDPYESYTFTLTDPKQRLHGCWISTINNIIKTSHIFGFNNIGFDTPILVAALNRSSCYTLYKICEAIIYQNANWWTIYKRLGLKIQGNAPSHYSQYDIFPILLRGGSLKEFAARIHCKNIQDLPILPGTNVTKKQMDILTEYCKLDVLNTIKVHNAIKGQIDLRVAMGDMYGIDLRSRGDASMAEDILTKKLGSPKRPEYKDKTFYYKAPSFIKFNADVLLKAKKLFQVTEYAISGGYLAVPPMLNKAKVVYGGCSFAIGIGGLHSQEKCQYYESNDNERIFDLDVASYYPNIVLKLGLYPKHLGRRFLVEYEKMVKERLKQKKLDPKSVRTNSLKIVINGTFGKFGSSYSLLYSPECLTNVTITGQLCLLMLIEMLTENGIKVVSANTDGVSVILNRKQSQTISVIKSVWEERCGFNLDVAAYDKLAMRDVNNYIAFKDNVVVKRKGIFTEAGLFKSPAGEVIYQAVAKAIETGNDRSIMKYIKDCGDIKQFLFVRKAAGGCMYKGEKLGRVARFIWCRGSNNDDEIVYANMRKGEKKHRRVANAHGCLPVMALTNSYMSQVDKPRYVSEAQTLYNQIMETR